MKTSLHFFVVASLFFFSCASSKKANQSYVPFTQDLKERIERNNIDLSKVQFYLDEKLVLTREIGIEKAEVNQGVVRLENGKYIHEVIIPAFTPGVCERTSNDGVYISFEKENSSLKFGRGSNLSSNYFTLYGRNWINGTSEVTYDGQVFRVSCASCSHAGSAKLVVKRSQFDKWNKTTKVVEGRRVGR
jgi:hypothetical protein